MHFSFLQKLGAAVLVTAWLIWGSNLIGDTLVPEFKPPRETGASVAAIPSGTAAKEEAPAEIEDIGPMLASVTAEDGEKAFRKCTTCHTIEKGGANKVGPNLWNVVGAKHAHLDDFGYSDALKGTGGTWTYEDLNKFLAKPKEYVPGTKMTFAGFKKASDRAAVIAYLREHSDNPPPLP